MTAEKNRRITRAMVFDICNPVLAVVIAFIVSGLMVLISGGNPLEAYAALAKGAFGSWQGFKTTIRYTLPILLLALSFAICNRCGYFNIGQEGQMYASALAITWIHLWGQNLPVPVLFLLMLLGGVLMGGLVSLIPAWLKHLLGINEVVIGILINYLLLALSEYMLSYTAIAKPASTVAMSYDYTPTLSSGVMLVAVAAIIVVYALLMKNSVPGYRLKMVGYNSEFSKSNGIKSMSIILVVAFLGGALSSIVSTGELLGVYHKMYTAYADGMGFTGMTAALIGRQGPVGMILGALLLGALQSGTVALSVSTDAPPEIVMVVRGFVMLFATISLLQYVVRKKKTLASEEARTDG